VLEKKGGAKKETGGSSRQVALNSEIYVSGWRRKGEEVFQAKGCWHNPRKQKSGPKFAVSVEGTARWDKTPGVLKKREMEQ